MSLKTFVFRAAIASVGSFSLFLSGCMGTAHNAHSMHGGMQKNAQPKASKINWLGFEEGQRRAKAENKLMIVDFYVSEGCPRCDLMAEKLWPNQDVSRLINENFIPVRVDLEYALPKGASALGKKYDYNYECLLVVCDATGLAVKEKRSGRMCFSEFVTAEWFIAYLRQTGGIVVEKDFFSDIEDS